jgi:type II secretory pathway pseudopilin PulG
MRRGFALIDAVIGGIILAIGLAVILSLGARAISTQREGEARIVAAHLADELLSTVQMEGPTDFTKLYDTFGRYDAPFGDFEYDIDIEERGLGYPHRVTATIRHLPTGGEYVVQTMIADREGEDPNPPRAPNEPLDRETRHEERGL